MQSVTSNAVALALSTLLNTKIGFVNKRTSTDSSSHTYFSSSDLPSNAIPIAVFSRDNNTYVLTNGGLASSYTVSVMKEKSIGGGYGWGLVTEVSCAYTVMYYLPS
jgi:hypothetical protein